MIRKMSLLLSAVAVLGMGSVTVACSPRTEKPAETIPSQSGASLSPTEKGVRTNVTRTPEAVSPGGGGNGAVPCGFGPAGGGPCTRHHR
jgi:hypothetical protein